MSKLIKKHGLGGIAVAVDSSLDGLGTWGKLGVQILDPTGITGWKDLGDSLKAFQKDGTILKAGELGLSALGVIPMFGMFKSFPKLLGLSKKVDKLGDASKLLRNVSDLPKGINVDIYKKILDPNFDSSALLKAMSSEELTQLKSCVEYSATKYLEAAGKNIVSPELTAKTKKYEQLLADIDKNIYENSLDDLYKTGDDVLVTSDHVFEVSPTGDLQWPQKRNLNRKDQRKAAEAAQKRTSEYIQNNPVIYFS